MVWTVSRPNKFSNRKLSRWLLFLLVYVVFGLFISLPSIENLICLKSPRSLIIPFVLTKSIPLLPAYWPFNPFDLMAFIIAKTLSLKSYAEAILLGAYITDISNRIEIFIGVESILWSFSYNGIQAIQIIRKICKIHVWKSSTSIISELSVVWEVRN